MRMSKSGIVITGAILLAFLIYTLSPGPQHLINNPVNWEWREQLVYLTGVCAMSLMVVSMLISTRIPWVSRSMQGLDKGYVVHKWTGILATIFVLSHFLVENVPHWLVEAGVIPNPGELTDASSYAEWEIGLYQSGMLLIQPMFYLMIALVVIALFKKIPYHWFRKSHKVFSIVFLISAWHGATAQLKERWLGSPGSYLLLLMLMVGVVASVMSLFRKIGASRKILATIISIDSHASGIIDLRLKMNKAFIYKPGQYVFLRFMHDDEPHPFSIASYDTKGGELRFAIKALGDFTSQLSSQLHIGEIVEVEGPYGEFHFNDECERQIWIAGGVGITPFMAQLDYLVDKKDKKPVDFYYSTRCRKEEAFPFYAESPVLNGVSYYHFDSTRKEYVTVNEIKHRAGDLKNTSIWFCGPASFADCIRRELKSIDFDMKNFHYDSFNMR